MNILDKIQVSLDANLPFTVYNKPNEEKLSAFFQQNDFLYTTKTYNEKGFVLAPFDDANEAILLPALFSDFLEEKWKGEQCELNSNVLVDEASKEGHITLVSKGIKAIKNGEFQKVVLSRREVVNVKHIDVVSVFKKLLNTYKNAFVYIWFHPKVGLWMGATPETLIKMSGSSFETMSLAGTQVFKGDETVKWKIKELEEQQLVTDYVLDKLQRICKSVNTSAVKTIRAGNLLHLKTIIKGEFLNNASELIAVLHPTPAVCGFPKNESKDFILKNESYKRSYYTGFLGEINVPNSELFVNLRCMELRDKKVYVYVGGGITKKSIPEREWNETVAKSNTIKGVL